MNYKDVQQLMGFVKYAPAEEQNRFISLLAKTAMDGAICQQIKNAAGLFNEKDISKMPKTFRKEFRTQGCTAHVRKRKSGKYTWNYEIRYRRNGYDIQVSANSLDEAKRKFVEKLNNAEKYLKRDPSDTAIPTAFDGFAGYFFKNFYKRKVAAETLRVALNQYKNHILPHFEGVPLKKITPAKCQSLIDELANSGKGKTSDDVFTTLNLIFKAAVKHGLLTNNPMDMVFHQKHAQEHGKALTKDEEKKLLAETAGTPYQFIFALALYTGLRPNEYKTAYTDGSFIIANNSKRKNGKVELKKIPITPMLKPYLSDLKEFRFTRLEQIRNKFNKILPGHKLYDLRTTFYTRCQECGVLPAARDEFVGHSLGALGNAYTDLSDEFLLAEGEKLVY